MYLHLGQDIVVRSSDIIGIFDIENTSVSKSAKEYLGEQEKRRRERARRIAVIEERLQELEQEMAECEGGDYVKLGELYHSRETLEEELLTLYEQQEAEG